MTLSGRGDGLDVGGGEEGPGSSEAAALLEGAEGEDRLAAVGAPSHPGPLEPRVTSVLHAASTRPEPIGSLQRAKLAYRMR